MQPTHIIYTDAYYIIEKPDKLVTVLPKEDAYGFVDDTKDESVIVHFIKKLGKQAPDFIVKGLVLPRNFIIPFQGKYIDALDNLKIGQFVSITWNDLVVVANEIRSDCSRMYTEGEVVRINDDHIVIGKPETIRTHPLPIKNHPKIKPLYYIIPKAIITDLEIFTDEKHANKN